MNLNEAKEAFRRIVSRFFTGASIRWTEQIGTVPGPPYLTLKFGSIQRRAFPVEDPAAGRCYHCQTVAEVNLYTKGKPLTAGQNTTINYANTAASDLMEFSNFLESEGIVDELTDMDVSLKGQIRDLSFLENDRYYRYRAMAEYDVSFVMEAGGRYAMEGMADIPNPSGGGTKALSEAETGFFTEAETEYEGE